MLAAIFLHLAMYGRWPPLHPGLMAGVVTAVLVGLTVLGPRVRVWRVCTRLLLLLVLSPAVVRVPILHEPGSVAILAGLAAWPLLVLSIGVVRGMATMRGGIVRRLGRAIAGLSPGIAALARAELALLRFGLFCWRKSPVPSGGMAFPNVATGTELALLWLTIAGSVVEIPLFHVLIGHFSHPSAWMVSSLELLGMVYMAGYAKSVLYCPTVLFQDRLLIRFGVVASRLVPLAAIEQVRLLCPGERRAPGVVRLFGLDDPNLSIRAGGQDLRFRVDHPERLLARIRMA